MTAVAAAWTPRRDRLIRLLGATAYGLHPEDGCGACPAGGRCAECRQGLADVDAVNDGITAVQDAATDIAAITAYDNCLLSLAGVTAGGDAGNTGTEVGVR